MKFYCAECFEEMGNCAPWCSEAARERVQRRDDHQFPSMGLLDDERDRLREIAPQRTDETKGEG